MSTMRVDSILSSGGLNTATINGITPALASQAEAQAGSDNTIGGVLLTLSTGVTSVAGAITLSGVLDRLRVSTIGGLIS